MKSSILALVLLVSSSAIAMERVKNAAKKGRDAAGALYVAGKTEVADRARGMYDATTGKLFAVPGQVTDAVKGTPGFVKEEAISLYGDTKTTVLHPQQTMRNVSRKAFTVAGWSAALGVGAFMLAEALEILGSRR